EVIALDKNNRAEPSEPKTTIIKLPESEDEDNNENEEDEDLEAVSNLQAAYDDQAGVIDVSWNYNGPPAEFKVTVNGQEQVTSNQSIQLTNVEPDRTYTISVRPMGTEGSNQGKEGPVKSTEIYISPPDDGNDNDDNNNNQNNDDNNNNNENN